MKNIIIALVTSDGRPFFRGVMIGALSLTLLTGYTHSQTGASFAQAEYMDALERADNNGAYLDDSIILPLDQELIAIAYNEDCPEFVDCAIIPPRKPEFGYSAEDRNALDALFAEVTQ